MLQDALFWFSSLTTEQYLIIFGGILLIDGPRYVVANMILLIWNYFSSFWKKKSAKGVYLPTVCALIPGLNEGATIVPCLESLHGSYPHLQIIVVDDGSTDNMYSLARDFAETHDNVLVLKRPRGGGKSSAQNFAGPYITAELIMIIDADSTFGENAIYKLIQPFRDPKVGGVSGCILVRNPTDSLCTLFQAYEYLTSILVGRILLSKLGILGIISGAFGAFRRDIFARGMGMDVGPGEDSDLTSRIHRMGYKVVFVPGAECFTNVPVKWKVLWKQRTRWNQSIVRFDLRKHKDKGSLFSNNFSITNFVYWCAVVYFLIWATIGFWLSIMILLVLHPLELVFNLLIIVSLVYIIFGFLNVLTVIFYSNNLRRDLLPCIVFPIYLLYIGLFLRAGRTIAILDEFLHRSSYRDKWVPSYVQTQVYHWEKKCDK